MSDLLLFSKSIEIHATLIVDSTFSLHSLIALLKAQVP